MVYDEGFDILINDYSFFAFSKYSPDKTHKWVSKCYSTLIGWFHKGDEWGCFYAEKQGENPDETTNLESNGGVYVVEGTVKEKDSSFMEDSLSVRLENQITNQLMNKDELVEKINSLQNLWSATNYNEFASMSIRELNQFAGRKKHKSHKSKKNIVKKIEDTYGLLETSMKTRLKKKFLNKNSPSSTGSSYPMEFLKWVPYMSPPRNQGKCGSCYAVATINMLEARLKIKHSENVRLSLDHILKCSVYNQGCEGGYSYLALKFANELELIPESCENRSGINDSYNCLKKCKNKTLQNRKYKVKDYKYLGGSYGKCSEELLMKELMENGPVVVSFEPDFHFMMYQKGIYRSLDDKDWMTHNLPKPEWEKVDHSVTLVGWGYDQKLKEEYWLLLNSWGENWGEKGYFKMIKGVDHLGIESICEVGSIFYIDN